MKKKLRKEITAYFNQKAAQWAKKYPGLKNKDLKILDEEAVFFAILKERYEKEEDSFLKDEETGEFLLNEEDGEVLYFSASEFNNGCTDRIGNPLFVEKDAIIYTTFGDSYYVKGAFTASDEISIFKDKNLNIYNGLFISIIIFKNKYKYHFGRKTFRNKFINDLIALPIDQKGNPDWQFMENYIKSLPYSSSL